MCNKIPHLWITSNNRFIKQIHLFSNQNLFGCYTSIVIYIFKTMCLFMGSEFSVSHHKLCTHSYTFTSFHHLLLPNRYFHFHVSNRATLLDFVQRYSVHQLITKHSVDSCHALTPMSCNVPMHKCNAMHHCMSIPCHIYDECYMNNLVHAYTMHLGQL